MLHHSRTYLVVGEVSPEQAPERIRKGLARHPIPLLVLARLAVAVEHQGRGLGAALLKDAIARTLAAAAIAGIRALAVHANDERARGFYETFGFRHSPTNPLHLIQLHPTSRVRLGGTTASLAWPRPPWHHPGFQRACHRSHCAVFLL